MSPAMVDFRSPASSFSSKVQSNHHRSQSVVTGATPSSPHYIFRSNGIPDPSPSMDRSNLVQGASAPTEKLSIPRFLKHRKRSGISRATPATIASDSGAGLGFGPFRSETLYAVPFDRAEDSGTQFVREQLYGWKPFESDASNRSSYGTGFVFSADSSGSNASSSNTGVGSVKGAALDVCDGGRGYIDKEIFVFGRGMEKVSSWSSTSSQSSSTQDLGNANSAKLNIFESGIPVGGSVSSLSEGNVFSDKGVFVFGAIGKNDGNLCHSRSLGSDNDLFYKLNSSKNVDEKSVKPDSVLFVHKNGEKKSTHPNKNSPFVSGGDVLFNEQPDRTRKKDLENSGDVDCHNANAGIAETKVGLDQTSTMCSNGSSFSSITKLPEDLMKLKIDTSENGANGNKDPGVFVFRSGVSNSNCASRSSSFEFFDSSSSKLPQKMEKLNLLGFVGEVHGEAETGVDAQFSEISSSGHDAGGFSRFTGELKNQNLHRSGNEELGNDNHGAFIFGSDDGKNANLGNSSFPNFDESSISNLPDQMKNMKLNNSGIEDDSQKNKPGNARNQHDNIAASNFISHSSSEDYGSRVAPLHAHNSRRLSAEPTSIPSVQPAFQTSVDHLYPTNIHTGSETPMEFKSQKPDTSLLTKENLFTKPHKSMASAKKKEDSKAGLRSKRGKSRNSTPIHTGIPKQFVSVDKGPEENQGQDSTGRDSPMDYSPYQETIESKTVESIHFDSRCASNDTQISGFANSKEGGLFSAVEHFDTNESLHDNKEADCCFRVSSARHFTSMDEMSSGLQKGSLKAINENVESVIEEKSSSMESESFSYDSSIKQPTNESEFTFNSRLQDVVQSNFLFDSSIKQPTNESEFTFNSSLQDAVRSNFLFTATSSAHGPSSSSKHNYRSKSKIKGGHEPLPNFNLPLAAPLSNLSLFSNAHMPTDPKQELKGSDDGVRAGKVHATKFNQESVEDACEKWRLRGNQAYSDGNLSIAEEFYSRGVDSFLVKEISKCCNRALMLCYSNRAATRMSLGRLREALNDCKMAVSIDPNFLRARVRAGNIHLSLGEPADALQHFEKVLQLDKEAKSDQKILLEAVDCIEKTQKLNDLTDQSSIFLTKRIPDDATKALEIISEALSIAPHSEILLEMKAEALVKLRNFDEAIQICEQTLEFAEKNTSFSETDCQSKDTSLSRFWRWRIISKSYFYLGKLEEANELLQKHEKVKPVIDKYWSRYPESSASFPVTVRELLRLKTAGNEAFQAGKHLEAVELYTAALALNTESRPFSAICFCNRAAAYQALGQITDAIADCSLAIALDSSYKRAISRRATLHEMIRDYGQAGTDLRKLTSLLEMHSEDKSTTSGALGRSSSNMTDLNQARMRLSTVEEEARKGGTLDMYMILGLERSCSATDVRKAYRKAALRHHPDKAGQFLARSENGDDRVWREIAEEVHSDADRLFKMIGEAYAILVDPSKRLQYDTEEELRTMKKGHGGSGSPRTPASNYSSHHWRSYGSSYRR